MMESDDLRVCLYGNTAIVTALTTTKGKFGEQGFTTQEGGQQMCSSNKMGTGNAHFRISLASLRSETDP